MKTTGWLSEGGCELGHFQVSKGMRIRWRFVSALLGLEHFAYSQENYLGDHRKSSLS
jgi:hypothetical protein